MSQRKGGGISMKMKWVIGLVLLIPFFGGSLWAQGPLKPLTLEESIKIALERSLTLHSAIVGVGGSEFRRKEAITNFLPWWTGQYGWARSSSPVILGATQSGFLSGGINPDKDIFNF